MINPELQDKVAIVTGANHGIGAETAKALATQGVKVLMTYLRLGDDYSRERTPAYRAGLASAGGVVLQQIEASGAIVHAFEADLSDVQTIPQLFDIAEKILGPVEILVNNAAYCDPDTFDPETHAEEPTTGATFSTFTKEKYERHFAVNVRAPALMMEEFARRHKTRAAVWGRIVNVSTDWADVFPTEISYGASKAALESYSRSAAVELGKYGITVNIVAPGPIQTGWMTQHVEELQAKYSPLGRIGTPVDVADVIVFLASEQARWLTGQRLYVGGGSKII